MRCFLLPIMTSSWRKRAGTKLGVRLRASDLIKSLALVVVLTSEVRQPRSSVRYNRSDLELHLINFYALFTEISC
jgi:hypothetical protein